VMPDEPARQYGWTLRKKQITDLAQRVLTEVDGNGGRANGVSDRFLVHEQVQSTIAPPLRCGLLSQRRSLGLMLTRRYGVTLRTEGFTQ
jgi:hypothetical protein